MAQIPQKSLTDTPLYRLTAALSRWFAVSVLWLVCSIPIVTLGASTKAALAVFLPEKAPDKGTAGTFFQAFRSGFLRITTVWLLTLVLMALLGLDVLFYRQLSDGSGAVLTGTVLLLGTLLLNFFRLCCFCAENAEAGLIPLFRNALQTGLRCLPVIGIFTAMDLAVFVTLVNVPYLLFLLILLPGLFAGIHARLICGFLNRCAV